MPTRNYSFGGSPNSAWIFKKGERRLMGTFFILNIPLLFQRHDQLLLASLKVSISSNINCASYDWNGWQMRRVLLSGPHYKK